MYHRKIFISLFFRFQTLCSALCESPPLSNPRSLHFVNCGLTGRCSSSLIALLTHTQSIRECFLDENGFEDNAALAIFNFIDSPPPGTQLITRISLQSNPISHGLLLAIERSNTRITNHTIPFMAEDMDLCYFEEECRSERARILNEDGEIGLDTHNISETDHEVFSKTRVV